VRDRALERVAVRGEEAPRSVALERRARIEDHDLGPHLAREEGDREREARAPGAHDRDRARRAHASFVEAGAGRW
jgi:hypothetical protein